MDNNEVIAVPEDEILIENVSDSPEDSIGELRRQMEDMARDRDAAREESQRNRLIADEAERRRNDAERSAAESRVHTQTAEATALDRQYDSVNSAIDGSQARIDSLTSDAIKAQEAGDMALMAKINVQLGREGAKLEGLEQSKTNLEAQKKIPVQEPRRQEQQKESPQAFFARSWTPGEFETVMRTYTPATAAWMRNNQRYGTDPSFRSQVNNAHSFLVSKGVPSESAEYFREIDAMVGAAPRYEAPAPAPTTYAPRGAQVAAPVSRSVPASPGNQQGPQRVKLTSEQRDIARIMFPNENDPETKYARYLVQDQREGRSAFPARSF